MEYKLIWQFLSFWQTTAHTFESQKKVYLVPEPREGINFNYRSIFPFTPSQDPHGTDLFCRRYRAVPLSWSNELNLTHFWLELFHACVPQGTNFARHKPDLTSRRQICGALAIHRRQICPAPASQPVATCKRPSLVILLPRHGSDIVYCPLLVKPDNPINYSSP